MSKPDLSTIPAFYHKYINLVQEEEVAASIGSNSAEMNSFLQAIPAEKWEHRYAEDKWSIKELVQHLIDTERIFSYRALCIARGEKQSLPGFEEKDYAAASQANRRSKEELLNEFGLVRKATETLFQSFNEEQLQKNGLANNKQISVNAIGFLTAGHVKHHLNILQERYL